MFIRAYLRASTKDQDADRARADLIRFAADRGMSIASFYVENESGAKLSRPELFRLLDDAQPGDVLLVEQVDRLSRLTSRDWDKLKALIAAKGVRVVALDLPTSHQLIQPGDEFTSRMLGALNGMMLDMLAAIARKDYEDRRRRTQQGIERAKAEGRFTGRRPNAKRHEAVAKLLRQGLSWSEVEATTGASRSTVARIARGVKAPAE
ncbi:recombinase family protein [Paenirhodobacter populi]|uniref:Resolvase n=1 Tax=Paenirhodobacter populi TaxID=2306993 RepID=A0A443IJG8_9RHOB|nr:recombinase family protein [Sinirhodobacter populi]RWR04485.1 resolvase [Sinirhodobacter populi]